MLQLILSDLSATASPLLLSPSLLPAEHSIQSWEKIDPELMLYLFLPALLFGEAMTLRW